MAIRNIVTNVVGEGLAPPASMGYNLYFGLGGKMYKTGGASPSPTGCTVISRFLSTDSENQKKPKKGRGCVLFSCAEALAGGIADKNDHPPVRRYG
ncbi:MAG: hypothetical protein IJF67_05020, partial [Clostridia bacterium]|nr:hypothetical protein [Clostridia bacterium]